MIQNLPQEILAKIYSCLSLQDARLLTVAFDKKYGTRLYNASTSAVDTRKAIDNPEKFTQAYKDRVNVSLYLADYFANSIKLLEAMLYTDTYISGSRGLNFFVPGSADTDSDWDFYIYNDKQKIYNFMQFMQKNNTKWFTMVEWFLLKLEDHTKVSTITVKEIRYLYAIRENFGYDMSTIKAIEELYVGYVDYIDDIEADGIVDIYSIDFDIYVYNKNGNKKTFRNKNDIYAELDIIRGIHTFHNRTYDIQLIISPSMYVLDTILEFYTSIVQCVITGFCAVHMYAADTYNMKSNLWITKYHSYTITRDKIDNSINKYTKRGFVYHNIPIAYIKTPYKIVDSIKRNLKDSESHAIDFAVHTGKYIYNNDFSTASKQNEYVSIKRSLFYKYTWLQCGRNLFPDTKREFEDADLIRTSKNSFIKYILNMADYSSEIKRVMSSLIRDFPFPIINSNEKIIKNTEKRFNYGIIPKRYLDQFIRQ